MKSGILLASGVHFLTCSCIIRLYKNTALLKINGLIGVASHKMEVAEYRNFTKDVFLSTVYPLKQPALLKDVKLGPALELWKSPDYLASRVGPKPVRIHVSPSSPKMDFVAKNFLYRTLPFDELVYRCSNSQQKEYFVSPNEVYYLRALGENPRKDIANFSTDYPTLVPDLTLPQFFPEAKLFSSVLRVASPGLQLWTHYDVMDNLLVQIVGRKRVVLFPPSAVEDLYLKGDKSVVIDIDNPNLDQFPRFPHAKRYECEMSPGDVLFLPALWFHNVTSLDYSVAVNSFWRGLDDKYYDSKDTYGNKDPPQVQRALQMVDKAVKLLEDLPDTFREFYCQRLIAQVKEKITI